MARDFNDSSNGSGRMPTASTALRYTITKFNLAVA